MGNLLHFAVPQSAGEKDLVDVSIRVLIKHAERLTDEQLYELNNVFMGALLDESGDPARKYVNDELETILQESREFDPEPHAPDYALIDTPYLTDRESERVAAQAANVFGASRLGEPAL